MGGYTAHYCKLVTFSHNYTSESSYNRIGETAKDTTFTHDNLFELPTKCPYTSWGNKQP